MATNIKKSEDEEEEKLLRQENERRTTEARSKVVEIREKSRERSEDDRRKRTLESIHRMEWLKNKDESNVLQRGTAKAKPRDRRKERVEVVINLEDLGLSSHEQPHSKYQTPPPPAQNAWTMKSGSALFPSSTAATMLKLKLKDYDEDAMLKKALEESLSCREKCSLSNSEEDEDVFQVALSTSNKSSFLARSVLGEERSRNDNPWVYEQGNDSENGNDIGQLVNGQRNDYILRGHTNNRPRNDIDSKPEMNNHLSPTMRQSFETPSKEFEGNDSNTTEDKASGGSSGGKIDMITEGEPIDYYKKGKELAEKRTRERALKFAAQEAEEKKKEEVAEEAEQNVSGKTKLESSPHKTVWFSPDVASDNNNAELKETTQTLPDTKASIVRLSSDSERLAETLKVPEVAVECQPPQVPGEQREFWTSNVTQLEPPADEIPPLDPTTLTLLQEVSSTNQTTSTQRLYTPEDFIVMDNAVASEMLHQLSLSDGAALDQYNPYMAYPYGIGTSPDVSLSSQYLRNPAVLPPNSFPDGTSSSPSFSPFSATRLMNNTAQNVYAAVPDALQTTLVAPQYNATNPSVEVTGTSPPKGYNLAPHYVISNPPPVAQNYYATNTPPPKVIDSVAAGGSSTCEVNANYQVPAPSPGVPTSKPNSVQNLHNVDHWLQLNILLSQCILSQLNDIPSQGGNVSMEILSSLIPALPNIPQTTSADAPKPPPPHPILEPNVRLPYSLPPVGVNPQSALPPPTVFQPLPNSVFSPPPIQTGYAHIQPPQRLPGSFIRGPCGRGRGFV